MDYNTFLEQKRFILSSSGFEIDRNQLNPKLYDFQRDIVRWALAKGKAAIFADCGLGKTPMQLEWAYQVFKNTFGNVLLLAPLAVSEQTKREGEKFGIPVNICRSQEEVKPGINITNYEMLHNFVASSFVGVILDESSILKHYDSKMRTLIIDNFSQTPYRLACTATPAPNDYMELGNHSEFLGVMTRPEMLSMYFVHDGGDTSKWRLKRHAEDVFWQWMASWSVFINNPSNLGYPGESFNLPALNIIEHVVDGDEPVLESLSLMERRRARSESLNARVAKAAEIANNIDGQVLVWCDLNSESTLLTKLIAGSVEVKGSDKPTHKANAMLGFSKGEVRVLTTKPSIAGWGMNWQNCNNMIFVGLSDSYEQYYQAVRRCWRFGQTKPVNVHIVISAKEGCVKENIERKTRDAEKMQTAMIEYTKEITKKELQSTKRIDSPYKPSEIMMLPNWEEMQSA
jgi:superfamily II DNA or RNA helicase